MVTTGDIESVLWDDWHAVAERETLDRRGRHRTSLLGIPLLIELAADGRSQIRRDDTSAPVLTQERYGHVWACLGRPNGEIVDFPDCFETDRHIVTGGSVGVAVSGLRAVENFLDMGHFPFVHTNYLGVEPHTEVKPYKVSVTADDEVLATDCVFYQPIASPAGDSGVDADYVYKVMRPYTVVLYKTNPIQPARRDFIALMVQPVDQERCVAHTVLAYLKEGIDAATVRWFMQLIFMQDKPILENQQPKRLPLDPRAEIPAAADASSVAYRRWLRRRGVRYGAIPADG